MFYAWEEFYARDLPSYYDALGTHPHHNYYEGRDKAPVTTWLGYFVQEMEDIFSQVSGVVTDLQTEENLTEDSLLRELDHRSRRVLALFARQTTIRSADVAGILGVSQSQVRELLAGWVEAGWLVVVDPSKRARKYGLSEDYRRFVE